MIRNTVFAGLLLLAVLIALAGLLALLIQAFAKGASALSTDLITNPPSTAFPDKAGYRPAIIGSLELIAGVILFVVPVGIGAALYLEEYADNSRWWNRLIEVNIQNLAAVPSIIYGILGLAFIVRGPLDLGFILAAGSLTLALLVLPMVIIAAREAIRAVPDSIRQGSLALGATQVADDSSSGPACIDPGYRDRRHPRRLPRARRDGAAAAGRRDRVRHLRPDPVRRRRLLGDAGPDLQLRAATAGGVPGPGSGGNHRHAGRPPGDELIRDLATKSLRAKVVSDLL